MAKRPGSDQEVSNLCPGGRGREPWPNRPFLPRNETFVPQQLGPRVIWRIAAWHALERIAAMHVDVVAAQRSDDLIQLAAARVGRDGSPVALKLIGRHCVHAAASR